MTEENNIQTHLYQSATDFIETRFPTGWGGVAVIRTSTGDIYTSVAIETENAGASLCIETGAICEAHKYQKKVTHCICVVRDNEHSPFKILSPCGICQERLLFWGNQVKVGVTTLSKEILFKTLEELQPFHWSNAYKE